MYAGVGTEGLGLGMEEISDNVFGALAEPAPGSPLDLFLFLAVVASSAANLITTFLPTSRTMLAMGTYKAFPERFATVHPRYLTPSYATIAAGVGAALFYSILTFLSESVLTDTICDSLGIMICFYYGLTAFACIWYFRHELFSDVQSFVFKLLFPSLVGLVCSVFMVTLRDSASPDYGSGASIFGVGLVLILGLGMILMGVVFMLLVRARQPAFFRGDTLRKDTPMLVVDEP